MIRCNNCGLEFSLFTEHGYEMSFGSTENVRKMIRRCGHCEQDSECLEWVDVRSKVADALSFAYECTSGVEH
jgi:hypothetical protein